MRRLHSVFGLLGVLVFINILPMAQIKVEVKGGQVKQPQQAASPQPSKKLTNQDIIDMAALKLSDDVIIEKIHSPEAIDFDTSVAGLKLLKAHHVSDAVVRAMINPRPTMAGTSDSVTAKKNAAPFPPQHTKLDAKAKEAVFALKKVQARTEIGADYRDYSSALADAYFSVKMFLESGQADTAPEFSQALRDSVTWYKTAEDVAKAMQSPDHAERDGFFLCDKNNLNYTGPALCKLHPELVESSTTKDGQQFTFIVIAAFETSLKRAGEGLEKADRYLNADQ
jgi:hypothetical protein